MKIRVLRNFDAYEAGQVFDDWPDGMCEILIARGLIEQAAPPQAESHLPPEQAAPAKRRKRSEEPS